MGLFTAEAGDGLGTTQALASRVAVFIGLSERDFERVVGHGRYSISSMNRSHSASIPGNSISFIEGAQEQSYGEDSSNNFTLTWTMIFLDIPTSSAFPYA